MSSTGSFTSAGAGGSRRGRLAATPFVRPAATPLPWQAAALLLVLALAAPARAARVEVEITGLEGLPDAAQKNVEVLLSIVQAEDDKDLTDREIHRLHESAPDEIALALEPFGYYRTQVTATLDHDPEHDDRWQARYAIDPGEPVRVRSIDVQITGEGRGTPAFEAAVADLGLAEGQPLVHAPYEAAKSALSFAAADLGYFDAHLDSSAVLVDVEAGTADVVIHFDTGPRYRFGELRLEQEILDPRMLQGYVTFKRGDPFEVGKLLALQSGLSQTPYFGRVEARPRPDEADGLEVPIEVEVSPRKTQHYEVGVGYGTDSGPRGKFKTEFRRLNRRGHRAEGEISVSKVERDVSARYVIPSLYPSTRVYTLFGGYQFFEPTSSKSNKWVLGGTLSQDRWGWQETLSLAYEHEEFEIGVDAGTSDLLIPGVNWKRTRADDLIDPWHGSRLSLDLRGSHDAVLASATFFQVRGDAKIVEGLGRRFRLISSLTAGHIATTAFRKLPATIRFFAGGDQSVRGYKLRALGPKDDEGNVIGGESLLAGTAELEYRFIEKLGIAAFFDIGNAFDPGEPVKFEKGTGAGLRWVSPIGMVRVDGAYAVGSRNLVRLHVMIGPDL